MSENDLVNLITQIHKDCYYLCFSAFAKYYANSGNIGIFAQSQEEYDQLIQIRDNIVIPSNNPDLKYFELRKQIVIHSIKNIPEISYKYLYIRKPDPNDYGKYLGDIDFVTSKLELSDILRKIKNGNLIHNTTIYNYNDKEFIQLSNSGIKSVGYLSTPEIAEYMRIRH